MASEVRELELPYPPTVNHYYTIVQKHVILTKRGRDYRRAVKSILESEGVQMFTEDIDLTIDAYPPDRRRRDADNIEKCLFDALKLKKGDTVALVEDDSLIRKHTNTMREPMPEIGGMVIISARKYGT